MSYFPYAPSFGDIYWIKGPDGTIARFNGETTDPAWCGMLTEVAGLESPEIRESSDELVEADGGVHGNFWLGRRPIVLTGQAYGFDTVTARAALLDRINRSTQAFRSDSELHWYPNGTVGQYVDNPLFLTDTSNWLTTGDGFGMAGGATLTRQTGDTSPVGTTAGRVVVAGGTANQGARYTMTRQFEAGVTYTATVYMRSISGTTTVSMFFGNAGDAGFSVKTLTGAWQRFTVSWTPAAAFTTADLGVKQGAATASTWHLTGAHVYRGSGTSYPFEDYSVPDMLTWVRRQQPIKFSEAWVKNFQIPLVSQYARLFSNDLHVWNQIGTPWSVAVENRGSFSTQPALRVTAGAAQLTAPFVVTNTTSAKAVRLTANLPSGNFVDIDTVNHTATLNGVTDWTGNIDFLLSTWPTIDTGTQTFALTAAGGRDSTTALRVAARDTWV